MAGALGAVAYMNEIRIISVYIVATLRRHGYGRELVEALQRLSDTAGEDHYAITVTIKPDEGTEAFFNSLGFDLFDGQDVCSIRVGEIMKSKVLRKHLLERRSGRILTADQLDSGMKARFFDFLKKNSLPPEGYYDPQWSTVSFENNEVTGVILIRADENALNVVYRQGISGDIRKGVRPIGELIRKIEADDKYDNSTYFRFAVGDDRFFDIISSVLGYPLYADPTERSIRGIRLLKQIRREYD